MNNGPAVSRATSKGTSSAAGELRLEIRKIARSRSFNPKLAGGWLRCCVAAALLLSTWAFLIINVVEVPYPADVFRARISDHQLGPYDHLSMAITIISLQISSLVAALLIIRFCTSCQRDFAVLATVAWSAQGLLALKYMLHFWGVERSANAVGLLGFLAVGWQMELMLIKLVVDCENVLFRSFGARRLLRVLYWEAGCIAAMILLAISYDLLPPEPPLEFQVVSSLVFWSGLFFELYFWGFMTWTLGDLACEVEKAHAVSKDEDNAAFRASRRVRTCQRSVMLVCFARISNTAHILLFAGYLWPIPASLRKDVYRITGNSHAAYLFVDSGLWANVWYLTITLSCLVIFGAPWAAKALKDEEERRAARRKQRQASYVSNPADDWQRQVEDLARRAITLDALLRFYQGLGKEYMTHFDPSWHTTDDIVRQVIIPLSKEEGSDMAKVLMKGQRVRPAAMVTHTWRARFRDLVAAVVADALHETEYGRIAKLLDADMALVRRWLRKTSELQTTYWICAFCVNQHASICTPSWPILDSSGKEVPGCGCEHPKFFNTDQPCRNGMSIPCEMNKFSDMIGWLAATDSTFIQVIATDSEMELFTRAWCVAEVAEAYMMGVGQKLKIESQAALKQRSAEMKNLQIEDMKASRVEDVQEILDRIPEKAEFNQQLQHLFGKLFRNLWQLHPSERVKMAFREVRWKLTLPNADDNQHGDDESELQNADV